MSTETRLSTLESQVAQILSTFVTSPQMGAVTSLFDNSISTLQTNVTALQTSVQSLNQKVAATAIQILNVRAYAHTQGTASSTWTITHSLGTSRPLVVFFNGSGAQLTPSTVTVTSENILTVTFSTAQSGTATILKA